MALTVIHRQSTYTYETLAQLVKSRLEAARLRVRRELRAGVQAFLEREGEGREEESKRGC